MSDDPACEPYPPTWWTPAMQAAALAYGRTLYRSDGYGYRVKEIIEAYDAVRDTEQQEQPDVEMLRLRDAAKRLSGAKIINAIAGRLSLANAPEHLERAMTELLELSSLIESREATNEPSGEQEAQTHEYAMPANFGLRKQQEQEALVELASLIESRAPLPSGLEGVDGA